jgi:hypothetical protein
MADDRVPRWEATVSDYLALLKSCDAQAERAGEALTVLASAAEVARQGHPVHAMIVPLEAPARAATNVVDKQQRAIAAFRPAVLAARSPGSAPAVDLYLEILDHLQAVNQLTRDALDLVVAAAGTMASKREPEVVTLQDVAPIARHAGDEIRALHATSARLRRRLDEING